MGTAVLLDYSCHPVDGTQVKQPRDAAAFALHTPLLTPYILASQSARRL